MNLIEFLFQLIRRFVPMDEKKIHSLEAEGKNWYYDKIKEGKDDQVSKVLREYGEHWGFQTFLACFYLYALRAIADFIAAPSGHDEDDED